MLVGFLEDPGVEDLCVVRITFRLPERRRQWTSIFLSIGLDEGQRPGLDLDLAELSEEFRPRLVRAVRRPSELAQQLDLDRCRSTHRPCQLLQLPEVPRYR